MGGDRRGKSPFRYELSRLRLRLRLRLAPLRLGRILIAERLASMAIVAGFSWLTVLVMALLATEPAMVIPSLALN
jgi:hypothetical protein